MLFDVQRREREGWTVLAVIGELDLAAVPRVRQAALQALLGEAGARIIVDLSSVDFLDSAGLGAVLGVIRRARQAGGHGAVVLDRDSAAGRVFAVLDLPKVVPIAASVDELLAAGAEPVLAAEGGGQDG